MEEFAKGLGVIVTFLVILTVVALLIALPTLLIVNYLFTSAVLLAVFGIPALTFWKAFWLTVLSGILFKSTGGK
jgi:hypothetical protein